MRSNSSVIEHIHQQLETSEKLFCSCKPDLFTGAPEFIFTRQLRPTQSELGQIDRATLFEFSRGKTIVYEANRQTSCLVEMDEEPPHNLNREALEIALKVASMIGSTPTSEIQTMRKVVIDGSTPFGFQRTCIVALGGEIDVHGKRVPIQHIGVEEDAARKVGEENSTIRYRIDRLGIPLIEVTTAPVIRSPKEAERVAQSIGRILGATGRVKRGLGTIRQDINISIKKGALTEIKGVQKLSLVSRVVHNEVQRQLNLLKIRDELQKRGVTEDKIKDEITDITSIFKRTNCNVIRKALDRSKRVLAIKLPRFVGLLKKDLTLGVRFGTEMADVTRFWGGIVGIFHTDELPSYGITTKEVDRLKLDMNAGAQDAVVFVVDTEENAVNGLIALVLRAREAVRGVPEETRAANADGTTRYMRPRPGAARMYPETDIPPTQVKEEYLKDLRDSLPELPESNIKRLMERYGINSKLAYQVLDSEYTELFERIALETEVSPTVIAAALTETVKALKRTGIKTERVTNKKIRDLFQLIDSGKAVKEAIPDVITWLSEHEDTAVEDAIKSLGMSIISQEELETIIQDLIKENESLVLERGKNAFGSLMGIAMKKLRGKVKAETVIDVLRKKLGLHHNSIV